MVFNKDKLRGEVTISYETCHEYDKESKQKVCQNDKLSRTYISCICLLTPFLTDSGWLYASELVIQFINFIWFFTFLFA